MLSSFDRSRSTRRTATVTISAPDASIARTISSFERYLPVPTIRRDRNARPAISSGASSAGSTADTVPVTSTSPDEVHQLYGITGRQRGLAQPGSPNDEAVVLDHDRARIQPEV